MVARKIFTSTMWNRRSPSDRLAPPTVEEAIGRVDFEPPSPFNVGRVTLTLCLPRRLDAERVITLGRRVCVAGTNCGLTSLLLPTVEYYPWLKECGCCSASRRSVCSVRRRRTLLRQHVVRYLPASVGFIHSFVTEMFARPIIASPRTTDIFYPMFA